jgi:hypothetical protein
MIFVLAFAGGCTSTHIVNVWRNPNFAGPIEFKKILAVAIHPDGTTRRIAEDEMVRQIGPQRCVAGYQVLDEGDRADATKLLAKAKSLGVDGLITIRILSIRTESTWQPSMGPTGFAGYYNGAVMVAAPGYLEVDHTVRVETRIYSVSDETLIWSGLSDTVDVPNIDKAVKEIANAVRDELRKEKLLVD